ncbi:DUF4358 domain-containing protein [Clostridium sp. C8-1-8]|uniref:DUF4358 domain-containing protein n=1 Tax=Clostridium sp. C8-1-8 TaxID=2698831 RepID=UPI00136B2052|nr:DUF4358 domain-containing protein [Clostridium sp. C8-1-8]
MKRIYGVFAILVMLVVVMVSCSNKQEIKVEDINKKIGNAVDLLTLKSEDATKLKKTYGIEENKLDGFEFYRADSNVKADEILIIKAKEKSDIQDFQDKINKRIEKQEVNFKDYLPEEYGLLKNSVVKVKGNIIIFVASKDADKIIQAFNDAVK